MDKVQLKYATDGLELLVRNAAPPQTLTRSQELALVGLAKRYALRGLEFDRAGIVKLAHALEAEKPRLTKKEIEQTYLNTPPSKDFWLDYARRIEKKIREKK